MISPLSHRLCFSPSISSNEDGRGQDALGAEVKGERSEGAKRQPLDRMTRPDANEIRGPIGPLVIALRRMVTGGFGGYWKMPASVEEIPGDRTVRLALNKVLPYNPLLVV